MPVFGTSVALGKVAKVVEGHQPLIGDALLEDEPGLILVVDKFPGFNTQGVTRDLEAALRELKPGALSRADLGVKPADIAEVEAFWLCVELDCSAAGFLLQLQDGSRTYLDVWIEWMGDDGNNAAKVDIEFVTLAAGQRYPAFPSHADPIGGWIDEVQPLNDFLHRMWQP